LPPGPPYLLSFRPSGNMELLKCGLYGAFSRPWVFRTLVLFSSFSSQGCLFPRLSPWSNCCFLDPPCQPVPPFSCLFPPAVYLPRFSVPPLAGPPFPLTQLPRGTSVMGFFLFFIFFVQFTSFTYLHRLMRAGIFDSSSVFRLTLQRLRFSWRCLRHILVFFFPPLQTIDYINFFLKPRFSSFCLFFFMIVHPPGFFPLKISRPLFVSWRPCPVQAHTSTLSRVLLRFTLGPLVLLFPFFPVFGDRPKGISSVFMQPGLSGPQHYG